MAEFLERKATLQELCPLPSTENRVTNGESTSPRPKGRQDVTTGDFQPVGNVPGVHQITHPRDQFRLRAVMASEVRNSR